MQSNKFAKVPDQKRCPMCTLTLAGSEFYKNHRDGLSTYCKTCSADRKRKGDKTKTQIRALVYPVDGEKICSKCGEQKPTTDFPMRTRNGKVSPKSYCKSCSSVIYKAWAERTGKQIYESVDARIEAEKAKTYPVESHKLCRCCEKVLPKEDFGSRFEAGGNCKSCRSTIEKVKYRENRDDRVAYAKSYREKNLESVRAMARRGAAVRANHYKKARAHGRIKTSDKLRLVAQHGYRCMCCGSEENITIDHIVPISVGGLDVIENAQLLCVSCNSSKGRRTIDYRPPSLTKKA